MEEKNELLLQRRAKLKELREAGVNPYTNDFPVTDTTADVFAAHEDQDASALEESASQYVLGGRIMARRDFGKAAFIQIQDRKGRIQVYVARDRIGEESFEVFRKLDLGDIGHRQYLVIGEIEIERYTGSPVVNDFLAKRFSQADRLPPNLL